MAAHTNPFLAPLGLDRRCAHARWMWAGHPEGDLYNCYAQFRRGFSLRRVPKRAPLLITADQSYELSINGEYVCRGPARSFHGHWSFDDIDVAAQLRSGPNIIAVRAYHPGVGNFQYVSAGSAGVLIAASWDGVRIDSGPGWRARRQTGIARGTVPASLQLFPQEHFDAREDAPGWTAIEFDDCAWSEPGGCRPWNAMPWHSLEPRGIPMLRESGGPRAALIGVAEGDCAEGWENTRDVCHLRFREGLAHRAVREMASTPLKIEKIGDGRWRSYLFDFGKPIVGCVSLEVRGARGGEIVDTLHTETIDRENLAPHFSHPSHCEIALGSRLLCRAGATAHTFHHFYGFRYLTLTVRNASVPLELSLNIREVGYPLERRGAFASSDASLNKIWETCAWTQRICSLDAYVDTPWREQAQWWGDARVQAWNTFHLSNDARLLRRGIHCIASQRTPNGLTYGHAPTVAHGCILPDFTLTWMLTLWDYYWQTGSLEAFVTHRGVVEKAFAYFERHTDPKTGLVGYDPRYWLFLDWTPIFKDGYPALLNLWLLDAVDKCAELYRLTGDRAKAKATRAWSHRLRKALARLIGKDGLMRDGFTFARKMVSEASIHTQTLALLTRLSPAHETAMMRDSLLPSIRGEGRKREAPSAPIAEPSCYWITYVFTALAERGHGREVIEFIRKKWAPMVEQGSTWEVWQPVPGDQSHSHAWSAHPLFHLMQIIGGIRQAAPGWSEITFAPEFIGASARCAIPSPRGLIRSSWERVGRDISVNLALPRTVRAHVRLPGMAPQTVTGASNRFHLTATES